MRPAATLIAIGIAAALSTPAFADRPGPDWMGIDQALRALTEAGYRDVTEIEADDGVWKAKAAREGALFRLTIDPRSGAIAASPDGK